MHDDTVTHENLQVAAPSHTVFACNSATWLHLHPFDHDNHVVAQSQSPSGLQSTNIPEGSQIEFCGGAAEVQALKKVL